SEFLALAGEGPLAPGWFVSTFNGFGPFAAAELLARARQNGLGAPDAAAVWHQFAALLAATAAGDFRPITWQEHGSERSDYWAFRTAQVPAEQQLAAVAMSAAVEEQARGRRVEAESAALRARLREALDRAL